MAVVLSRKPVLAEGLFGLQRCLVAVPGIVSGTGVHGECVWRGEVQC